MTLYLEGLNTPQQAGVEAIDGPVLILAGAGTGKTRVLTARLAHILATGRAWPSQILAVTFTNKAATEMRTRVESLLSGGETPRWLGTFHALAAKMLRAHADHIPGLSSNFTILDMDDQTRLVKQVMEGLHLGAKKNIPRSMAAQISRWKDGGVGPEGVTQDEKERAVYAAYQERLRALNACDFGDLLLHIVTIFKAHKDILNEYHRRFRYILVDEYQDTNAVQYLWLRLLAQGSGNICCVGDDDQSIYGWRGAEVGNILRFGQDFPGAQIIRLEQNYRSTGHILAAAGALINHNKGRLGKTLWSAGDAGEKVIVENLYDGAQEASWVVDQIQNLKVPLSEVAVLVRAGFQTREFEEAFLRRGIPYRVIGGLRFYERAEVRDILAYLRVIAQPNDDLALERIINTPKRSIGDTVLGHLHTYALEKSISLYAACVDLCATPGALRPAACNALSALTALFERWRGAVQMGVNVSDLAAQVLEESGYMAMAKADKTPEGPGRVENLKELISGLEDFTDLGAFLEHVSLVMEGTEKTGKQAVSLMTLHGAKGLEFAAVFLPGWEEGLFPGARALSELGQKGLEEERRLAYVGLTRAKARAFVSFAQNRRVYGQWMQSIPSRFVGELPKEHIGTAIKGQTPFGSC